MSLAIQLPPREDQKEFNLRVWERLLADPELAKIPGRIETNRHGQILMSPPPSRQHGSRQFAIARLLDRLMGDHVQTESPVSTSDGVRSADVTWASPLRQRESGNSPLFVEAPEICVEVVSPSNIKREMEEKMALYFDAGAEEVWFCGEDGAMRFHAPEGPLDRSRLCPDFPIAIEA